MGRQEGIYVVSLVIYEMLCGNERLMIEAGLLKTTLDETLLYRIVDVTMVQTLAGKIFGTGDLIVKTKVDSNPEITLKNISEPKKVRAMLSEMVEDCRQRKNVVGREFYGEHSHTDENEEDEY